MTVAPDQSEALLSWTVVTEAPGYFGAPLRLAGLDAAADYRISRVWPPRLAVEWPATEGAVLAGSLLMQAGLQPPRLRPETAVVLHLQCV
jgi:alpha-galactosidase